MHRTGIGKGHVAYMSSLNVPLSPNICVFTNQETFRTPPFPVSMEASLPRHEPLNHWPLVAELDLQPFLLYPEFRWWNRKFQTSNYMVITSGDKPHLWVI